MTGKPSGRKKPKKQSNPWKRRSKQALAFATILFLGCFITVFVMFLLKLRDAKEDIAKPEFQDKLEAVGLPPTRILTADGVELYRVSAENRLPIKDIDEVPDHVKHAFLAAEDKRFYQHPGVDELGLLRAVVAIFKDGKVSQGGSTLTMQLSKLLFTSNDRSFGRKIQDIAYAYALEETKSKDQILLLYLNKVFFGENAHGLKAASQVYFDKDFRKLTAGEAALLARSVQRPSEINPIKSPERAMQNRDVVLRVMHEEGWINQEQLERNLAEVPKINKNPPRTTAFRANFGQHFVQHVLQTIQRTMPELDYKSGGYVIHTTLDSKLQKLAEKTVRDIVQESRGQRVNQGAFVAMDANGRILCEVGGVDFNKSQYNIISQGRRQPGSAFKAILYATAFHTGTLLSAHDYVSNAFISKYDPWSRTTWQPKNSASWETAGGYSARTAFAASINRPAIHLIEKMGPQTVVQHAKDIFGIESPLDPVLPLALGSSDVKPLEMLQAYSVFMTGGDRVTASPIERIVSADGELVKRFAPKKYVGVLSSNAVNIMDELTRAVVQPGGTARQAGVVPNAHGKTGTTNKAKDAWFCGYTDGLVGVAWVGNEQIIDGVPTAQPMGSSVFGGTVSARIWAGVMKSAHERFGKKVEASSANFAAAVPTPNEDDEVVRAVRRRPVAEPEPANMDVEPVEERDEPPIVINVPERTDERAEEERRREEDRREEEQRRREAERRAEQEQQRTLDRILAQERERERRREAERRRRQEQEVTVIRAEICADSGQRANIYCPETVLRSFTRGTVPAARCRQHGN